MPKGRRAQKTGTDTRILAAIAVAVLAVGAGAYVLVRDDGPDPGGAQGLDLPDVHGIAASPTEPGVLFVATHQGLVRHDNGRWTYAGSARDDYMGFTMHPTDAGTFWTSGHPAGGGNMGVRFSDDGGATWRTLWSEPVDFHAMAVSPADPDRLWGWWQRQVLRSDDGGATWAPVSPAPAIRGFAPSPASRDVMLAATGTAILRSDDGGATWTPHADIPAFGVAYDPTDAQVLYAGGDGALWKSTDGGGTWRALQTPGPGAYAYLSVSRVDARIVYVATYQAGVYVSEDGGGTWRSLADASLPRR